MTQENYQRQHEGREVWKRCKGKPEGNANRQHHEDAARQIVPVCVEFFGLFEK